MSVRGFNTGTGVERYDYNALDNVPLTTNTRVKGDAEVEYREGDVNLTKANIGLGNVDNTSDADKPVSTAQQRALDGKVDKVTGKGLSTNDYTDEDKNRVDNAVLQEDLDAVAPVIINTASGAIASFPDGADSMPVKKLVAQIEPVQDLHGYANPWPGGAEVNKLNAKERAAGTLNGIASQIYSNNRLVMSGTATAQGDVYLVFNTTLFVPANSNIVVSWYGTDNRDNDLVVYLRNINNQFPFYRAVSSNSHNIVFNIPDDQTFNAIMFRAFSGTTITFFDCNVEVSFGDAAPATYSPYSNICPISGWTGAEITGCGKNLFNKNASGINSGHALSPVTGTEYSAASYSISEFIKVTPGSSYVTSGIGDSCDACFYNSAKQRISGIANLNNGAIAPENAVWIKFDYKTASADTVQLESNTTATTYEPYTGNQISVTFPSSAGTVYGGTLTLNPDRTGTLVVDRASETFTGEIDESWQMYQTSAFMKPVNGKKAGYQTSICDKYRNLGDAAWVSTLFGVYSDHPISSKYIYFRPPYDGFTFDTANWRTWLAENSIQFVYELEEPITITLTESESGILETLYGTNNIWADTGDVTVTAPRDTKLYIDNKITQAIANALNS